MSESRYLQESNGLAHGELLHLLQISKSIAQAKTIDNLRAAIRAKVNQLIPFDDTEILIVDSANQLYDNRMHFPQTPDEDRPHLKRQAGKSARINSKGYVEEVNRLIAHQHSPIIEDFQQRADEFDHPFLSSMKKSGFREGIVTTLKADGVNTLALFWLNSTRNNNFSNKQFKLFEALAEHVSVALTNALANEEMIAREKEKNALLSLSETIATTRDTTELWKVMLDKVKPLVGCKLGVTTIYSSDFSQYRYYLFSDPILQAHLPEELKQHVGVYLPIANTSDEWVLNQGDVCTLSTKEKELLSIGNPEAVKILKAVGIEFSLYIKLKVRGKIIGVQHYHFERKDQVTERIISFARSITDLIALAMANVLADADIRKRAKEKTLLLGLSTELSFKKDIRDVTALVFKRVQPLINAEAIELILLSQDKKHYRFAQYESTPEMHSFYQNNEVYQNHFDKSFSINNDPFFSGDTVFEKSIPFYASITDILKRYPSHCWAKLLQQAGVKSTTGYVLRINGETLGVLFWHWRHELSRLDDILSMIQGIGDMAAIAISNLLSLAELQERSKQIQILNSKLEEENAYLEEEILGRYNFAEIIGESAALRNIFHNIQLVSKSDTTVLITGESGTGKELIARAIHESSDRKGRSLIKLNCAALPTQLIESELFGHEKGAFTGAIEKRIGKFELAHDSTIFLDEVGELPLDLQAKLLRVLQEKELERIGGNKVIKTNVRVLSATNRDLQKEVQAGRFRSDLYYRLNVFPIHVPPLRERPEDIPPLVQHFLRKYQKKLGKQITGVSKKVMNELRHYSWPGNIRELEHVLERSCILCSDKIMKQIHLPTIDRHNQSNQVGQVLETLAENERNYIIRALQQCNGKVSGPGGAAELLNMKPTTLEFRMKKLGIKREFV